MSPKQIAGYLALAALRRKGEMAERLAIGALAAQGERKAINDKLKELGRG